MKIVMTKDQIAENLGELRFMGATSKDKYQRVGDTQEFVKLEGTYVIEYTIGAPFLGKSITVKVDSREQTPNMKPYAPVELINLAYDPTASATSFNGNARGTLVDRFNCEGVKLVNPSDVLANENGEKMEHKKEEVKAPNK
ncbi:hypothetical protein [Listeria rustica]|uniref:Uncharacterized protein n=1 Tax=Listeria rustica TaxID=2713503 RepID=A0A7W1T4W0_9LIST|nr:hypothetical protein [Listeria rustica]MBA3925523.1 hypothetical protein [Listeria rustica]